MSEFKSADWQSAAWASAEFKSASWPDVLVLFQPSILRAGGRIIWSLSNSAGLPSALEPIRAGGRWLTRHMET